MIEDLLILLVPYGLAMLAALGVPMLALLQYRWAARIPADVRVALLLLLVAAGTLVSVAIGPRVLNDNLVKPDFVYISDSASSFLASRIFSALVVGAALVEILRGWRDAVRRQWRERAATLVLAVLAYFFGTLLLQAVASEHPGFSFRNLYVPVVVLAACLTHVERIDRIVLTAKWCIFACTFGSLVMAVARPDFALATPYREGFVPGIQFRLFGLAPHANSLGPIALVGLLLELHTPSPRRGVRWAHLGAAAAVLLLAQSKTAWVAGLLIPLVTWVPLNIMPSSAALQDRRAFTRAAVILTAGLLALATVVVLAAQIDLAALLRRSESLLTLTGRIGIWDITLEEWRKNIFFGYGPDLWSVAYRRHLNMLHAGHAHNQFIQTLGDSGLFGLAALLAFLGAILAVALRRFRATRGLLMALFVLLLARCITEAALRSEGLLSWTAFINILVVVLASHFVRQGTAPSNAPVRGAMLGWGMRQGY